MLAIITGAARIIVRRWPMLLAWYLAATTARFGVIQLAAFVGAHWTLGGLLILPLAALCRLTGLVGMFFVVRDELAVLDDGRPHRFLTVLTRSILPFFVFYSTWRYLAEDVRTYAEGALDNVATMAYESWQTPDVVATGDRVLQVSLSLTAVGFIVAAFGVRYLLQRFEDRLPRWTRIGAAYLEAVWVLLSLIVLSQLIGRVGDWVSTRRGLAWYFDARDWLDTFLTPIGVVLDAIGWLAAEATSLIVLPLAWLTIAGVVYDRQVDAGELDLGSRSPMMERIRSRVRVRMSVPKMIMTRVVDGLKGFFGQWISILDALKIVWRAGVAPLGLFVFCFAFVLGLTDLLTFGLTRLIGPHSSATWWIVWLDPLRLAVEAVVTPVQIALISSAYAYCITSLTTAPAPPPAAATGGSAAGRRSSAPAASDPGSESGARTPRRTSPSASTAD